MKDHHESPFEPVATFVLDAEPAIPDSALAMAARLMIDTLGVAAGAQPLDAGRIARETALALYGAADPRWQARMMFDGRVVSLAGAAFAAASQIDNLDGHDGLNPTKGHIGCAVVPALFAFAAQRPDMTGREALAAMVIAYEVAARAAFALHATVSDYHTSGAWNALGVAAGLPADRHRARGPAPRPRHRRISRSAQPNDARDRQPDDVARRLGGRRVDRGRRRGGGVDGL